MKRNSGDVKNVTFLKNHKVSQDCQKRFLGMFCVCFIGKWCATLSSALSLGGPEGQVCRFNAKVLFRNTSEQKVHCSEGFFRNQ